MNCDLNVVLLDQAAGGEETRWCEVSTDIPDEKGVIELKGEYGRASCTLGMRGAVMPFGRPLAPLIPLVFCILEAVGLGG